MWILSSLLRAWYTLLGLGLVTFVLAALVERLPFGITSAIAMPYNYVYRAGINLRQTAEGLVDRRSYRAQLRNLEVSVDNLLEDNRRLVLELERLRQLLEVRTEISPGAVFTVPVIGGGTDAIIERLTVGRGSTFGVVKNMPVVVPAGLVGLVTDVSVGKSLVRTITDSESRVGVTVRGKGGQGIAHGEPSGRVRVTGYRLKSALEIGDLVETSSQGGLFPRGLLVGVIVAIPTPDPNDLHRTFVIRPAVGLSTLLQVTLIQPL
jgi:rod shape-determining protein MreC